MHRERCTQCGSKRSWQGVSMLFQICAECSFPLYLWPIASHEICICMFKWLTGILSYVLSFNCFLYLNYIRFYEWKKKKKRKEFPWLHHHFLHTARFCFVEINLFRFCVYIFLSTRIMMLCKQRHRSIEMIKWNISYNKP